MYWFKFMELMKHLFKLNNSPFTFKKGFDFPAEYKTNFHSERFFFHKFIYAER